MSFRQALADIAATLGQHVEEATLQRICAARGDDADKFFLPRSSQQDPGEPDVVLNHQHYRSARSHVLPIIDDLHRLRRLGFALEMRLPGIFEGIIR